MVMSLVPWVVLLPGTWNLTELCVLERSLKVQGSEQLCEIWVVLEAPDSPSANRKVALSTGQSP